MAKDMKTRKGKDNVYYPYTSPDIVVDSAGESQTTKNNNMKTDIDNIKTDLGNAQLTTTAKNVKGAINELDTQYKDMAKKIEDGNLGTSVEPELMDMPRIYFSEGTLPTSKTATVMKFDYYSKTKEFHGYVDIKCQGNSSMAYPKKNFTIKLYKDKAKTEKLKIDFKGWGKQSKFVLKANWIDLTHARNVVSARLWGDTIKTRNDYATALPELLRTSPNQGAVDGFPVLVYSNGVYQGRYTLNIPKDKWMSNMDDALDTHCILCGENYQSGCFRALPVIDGTDWTDELHDVVPATIKTSWSNAIKFVMESSDDEFKANLSNYFDINSLIDYYLYGLVSTNLDGFAKNQLFFCYDGVHWIASVYDLDSTWGLYWNGSSILPTDYKRNRYEDYVNSTGNLLYNRLEYLFTTQLKTRYAELRKDVLSASHIIQKFEEFNDVCPKDILQEDYASTTGGGRFTGIPSTTTNNIQQLRNNIVGRLTYVDNYINALQEAVPCTNITLNNATLSFTTDAAQTLTATVTPTNTTDTIAWSVSPTGIVTVNAGVVTPVKNGSCTITATCGTKSATCNVTVSNVSSVPTINYELSEPLVCDGTSTYKDTGVQLLSSNNINKDWTMLVEFTPAQLRTDQYDVIVHCMKEADEYPGINIDIGMEIRRIVVPNNKQLYTGPQAVIGTAIQYALVKQGKVFTLYDKTGAVLSSAETDGDITPVDQTLLLGAYQTVDGAKGRFFKGTINKFKLVEEIYTVPQIKQYFGIVAESIAYTLPQETTFNGTSDFVDTGVQLFDTARDFTIAMDVTADTPVGASGCIIHCMKEESPYPGLSIQSPGANGYRVSPGNNTTVMGDDMNPLIPISQRTKVVIVKDGTTMKVYNSNNFKAESPYVFKSIDQTLLLGAYQNVAGTKGRFFKGTIHEFSISNTVYTNEQINIYLGVNVATD